MEIKSAEFIKGVVTGNDFWDTQMPQIVFYGRSNTGKSSSINAVLNRNSLARPSGTPGKTREANFFEINNSFYVVDLPGYGYAKISKTEQEKLRHLILWFVGETKALKRIHVIVLDAKVGLTDLDKDMLDILNEERQEHVIALMNKTDKLNQKELSAAKKKIEESLPPFVTLIPFSATKKKGVEKFWKKAEEILR
jgi:GTP-binding protein